MIWSRHKSAKLGPAGRWVATSLALIWVVAGGLTIVLGMVRGYWVAPLIGLLALVYGIVWAQVAITGRRIG